MTYEPLLGQMVFGNAWGVIELPRTYGIGLSEIAKAAGLDPVYAGRFENEVFIMRPYYWGDCECGNEESECHEANCPMMLPNFTYKPTELDVYWYKYISRGMSVNRIIDFGEWCRVLADCMLSLKGVEDDKANRAR